MSFVDQTIQIVDEQAEMGRIANVQRRAEMADSTLRQVDTHAKLTLNQVAQVFNMGFNVFQQILNTFGISLPPVAGAVIQSLMGMVSAYSAAAAASAAGHDYIAAGLIVVAVISMISNIASAVAANEATEKALRQSQQLAQSMIGFANSWRFLY